MSQAFGIGRIKRLEKEKEKEVFEELVAQCDTTEADQKIATGEKIFAEKHTVPSEYEVLQISTRAKVEFNK